MDVKILDMMEKLSAQSKFYTFSETVICMMIFCLTLNGSRSFNS